MTRNLIFVFSLAMLAPLAVASPPPDTTFVFHNETGGTLTDVNLHANVGNRAGGGAFPFALGTIANGATKTVSFGRTWERADLQNMSLRWVWNGQQGRADEYYLSNGDTKWSCFLGERDNTQYCTLKYRSTWTDYRIDFYLQKQ